MDIQQLAALLAAIAGLLTSAATLIKVLQHEPIIKQAATAATANRQTLQAVTADAEQLAAHITALAAAAEAFAQASKKPPTA